MQDEDFKTTFGIITSRVKKKDLGNSLDKCSDEQINYGDKIIS